MKNKMAKYGRGDLGDFIEFLKENMDSNSDEKVVKSIPATQEQIDGLNTLHKLSDEADLAKSKHRAFHQKFWASLEIELSEYRHMRYNEKTKEFEVFGNPEGVGADSIPSPFAK